MDKIQLIKKMCADNPENAEMKYLLGMEYKDAGMVKESISAFSDALNYAEGELEEKIISAIAEVSLKKKSNSSGSQETAAEKGYSDIGKDVVKETGKANDTDEKSEIFESEETDEIDETYESSENEDDENMDEVSRLRIIRGGNNSNDAAKKQQGFADIKFRDVGGLDDLKNAIKIKIIKPFLTPRLFERFKKKSGGGLLLFGPPGCGKTFIARATAGECSAVFKPVHITDVLDPYFGQSALNIKDIFSVARAQRPCILFFDEIDTIGFNRAKTSTDMMRSVVDQLLSEIEGIDSNTDRILIIGATNMPWDVDPALRRPGRFDRTIFVPPPDINAREVIYKLKMEGRPCENIDYKSLARESELFSGPDIENVIETATENVLEEILSTGIERNLTQNDLARALKSVKPSTVEWLRTIANYVKYSNQSGVYDDVERYLSQHKRML